MKSILCFGLVIFAGSLLAAKPGVTNLSLFPRHSTLKGSKAGQTLLVTANYGNGEERDVTRQATFRVAPKGTVAVSSSGVVSPLREGKARIEATFEGKTAIAEIS